MASAPGFSEGAAFTAALPGSVAPLILPAVLHREHQPAPPPIARLPVLRIDGIQDAIDERIRRPAGTAIGQHYRQW